MAPCTYSCSGHVSSERCRPAQAEPGKYDCETAPNLLSSLRNVEFLVINPHPGDLWHLPAAGHRHRLHAVHAAELRQFFLGPAGPRAAADSHSFALALSVAGCGLEPERRDLRPSRPTHR